VIRRTPYASVDLSERATRRRSIRSCSGALRCGLLLAAVLYTAATEAQVAPGGERHRGIHAKRDMNPNSTGATGAVAATNPNNIPYLGGPVLPNPTIYAMWWGNRADFPSDLVPGISEFFNTLNETAYLHLTHQYLFGEDAQVRFGGNLFDSSAPPAQAPATTEIVAEVCKVLDDYGRKPDSNAIYAVYTSNNPPQNIYCAFHDIGACPDGTNIHIMLSPNNNDEPLCWVQPPELSCNRLSNGLQAAANSWAHELMETMTDPDTIDGWNNASTGNEIGDPCNFTYKRCVTLSDGHIWQLQEMWSNKVSACVQGAGNGED